ncbi:MAG TPA: AI-2E family transporter [Phycisphaerales bacterium]
MARTHPIPTRPPVLLGVFLAGLILYFAREVLIPIVLATFIAFLLAPFVRALERMRLSRAAAVIVTVAIATIGVGAVGWLVEEKAFELASQLPKYKANIINKLSVLKPLTQGVLDQAGTTIQELGSELVKSAKESSNAANGAAVAQLPPEPLPVRVVADATPPLTYASTYLGPLLARMATAGMVVVFTIFMLLRREDLRSRVIRLIGPDEMHHTTPAFDDAAQRLSRFLLVQTLLNASIGGLIGLGLFFLHVPGAALWGLVIALLRFVPYVGTMLGAAFPIALSLATSPGWTQPLQVLVLIVVVDVAFSNFVEPMVVGAGTGLSPLAVLASAVLWTWLWGPVGLILATPITVCLAVLGKHVRSLWFLEILLGTEPVLTPQAACYQRLLAGDQEEATRLVDTFAQGRTSVEVYDGLLLPALALAERDRHRGELDERREQSIRDILAVLIEDVGARDAALPPAGMGPVVCVPARDAADELTARMLERVLTTRGIAAETLSCTLTPREAVRSLTERPPAVVCICALPPGAMLHTRVLWHHLERVGPRMIIGVWDDSADREALRVQLGLPSQDGLATSIKQAADEIDALRASDAEIKKATA